MVTQSVARRQPSLLHGAFTIMAEHHVYHFDATQFTSAQFAHPTCEDRALVRALAEGLTALRIDSSTWAVTSGSQAGTAYTVRQWGTRGGSFAPAGLACSCECGKSGGTVCKHRALVAHELAKHQQPANAPAPVSIAPAKPATVSKIASIADLYTD